MALNPSLQTLKRATRVATTTPRNKWALGRREAQLECLLHHLFLDLHDLFLVRAFGSSKKLAGALPAPVDKAYTRNHAGLLGHKFGVGGI